MTAEDAQFLETFDRGSERGPLPPSPPEEKFTRIWGGKNGDWREWANLHKTDNPPRPSRKHGKD